MSQAPPTIAVEGIEHMNRRGNAFSRWLGRMLLRVMGWRIQGRFPAEKKMVVLGAPHTSNWDFLVAMVSLLALGLDFQWIGKHTIFRWPFGVIWRWLGGSPVDRRKPEGVVEQIAAHFKANDFYVLGLSPEGTRRLTEGWKSGFHRIAMAAGVPILCVSMDYAQRMVTIGKLVHPTGDLQQDLVACRAAFHRGMAKRPELYGEEPASTTVSPEVEVRSE